MLVFILTIYVNKQCRSWYSNTFVIQMALFLNYLIFCFFQQREVKPYWNLSVKILHAKIHRSYDYGETISFQIHLHI